MRISKHEEAMKLFQECLSQAAHLRERTGEPDEYFKCMLGIADYHMDVGEPVKALESIENCRLEIIESLGKTHGLYLVCLQTLAVCLYSMKHYAAAFDIYKERRDHVPQCSTADPL